VKIEIFYKRYKSLCRITFYYWNIFRLDVSNSKFTLVCVNVSISVYRAQFNIFFGSWYYWCTFVERPFKFYSWSDLQMIDCLKAMESLLIFVTCLSYRPIHVNTRYYFITFTTDTSYFVFTSRNLLLHDCYCQSMFTLEIVCLL